MDRASFEQLLNTGEFNSSIYVAGSLTGPVFICRARKDADALHELGYDAAVSVDGWPKAHAEQLRDVFTCIMQGSGEHTFANKTAAALYGVVAEVRILDVSKYGSPAGMISSLGGEGTCEAIADLIEASPKWESPVTQTLDTISATDLQRKDIPPIKFIVDDLLPTGLNILASPPKYGKSWMVLALCLAVATGGRFLGYSTNKCGCLYLALEDSQRRLKSRMNKLLDGKSAPAEFHFATTAYDMDNGLFDQLGDFLKKHPDTALIVIDTLQRVRGSVHGREGSYAADYREVGALKAFADSHNVAVLLVHHLRKMKDDGDPFNMISGTNGIMGAADTTMVLTREKRGADHTILSIVGRDVESSDSILQFNKESCYWENLGDSDWFTVQQARRDYQESPVVTTIKGLLKQSPNGWSGSAKQLLEAGTYITRTRLADSSKGLNSKLNDLDDLLLENDNIVHERMPNGSGGARHRFYFADVPQFEELEPTENDPFLGVQS